MVIRKRAFYKDLLRTILRSKARFFSILAIIALGTGFYAGISAAEKDMKLSADNYFRQCNLSDFKLTDPLGFTDEQIAKVAGTRDIGEVHTGYSMDVFLASPAGSTSVVKIYSYGQDVNKPRLKSGRMPEKPGEIAVESGFRVPKDIKEGSRIKLSLPDGEKISDKLSDETYTVTGIVDLPIYIGLERGRTNIGGGSIDFYAFAAPGTFVSENPTDIYAMAAGTADYQAYSPEYDKYISSILDRLDEVGRSSMSAEIAKRRSELKGRKAELEIKKNELRSAQVILGVGDPSVLRASSELAAAETAIADAEKLVDRIPENWIISDRTGFPGYSDYAEDALRVGSVAQVIPLFFFMVAALVCLTTMTRMIEEERTEIGTMKSIGYSAFTISSKYLAYALLSSLIGALIGMSIGFRLFPWAIMDAYSIMYKIPVMLTPWDLNFTLIAFGLSVYTTTSAALIASAQELRSTPAALLQPRAPKPGKRVFLERIGPMWQRLSFLHKVTARNILRYKMRFYMTVLGIAGCTALLVTGFGLKDSVNDILGIQFVSIFKYDGHLVLDRNKATSDSDLADILGKNRSIGAYIGLFSESGSAFTDVKTGKTYDVNIMIPTGAGNFRYFIDLHERVGKKPIEIPKDGAVIDEKLAEMLHAGIGDTITYRDANNRDFKLKIAAVNENYLFHYIYMDPDYYKNVTGATAKIDSALFKLNGTVDERSFKAALMEVPGVLAVTLTGSVSGRVNDALDSLNFVVFILILSAGALAMVVLYNLTNINITERLREISTIKVLGFRDNEVSAYVYRENMILALVGTLFGLFLGFLLHKYVISTMEINTMMFGKNVHPMSYLLSIVLTFAFTVLVNFLMYFKLRAVDMVESLKSVE